MRIVVSVQLEHHADQSVRKAQSSSEVRCGGPNALDLESYETWASGASMVEAAATPTLYIADGGDIKRQASCAGRPDVARLTAALRKKEVNLTGGRA